MAKKGLGRGFESLIPDNLFDETFDPTAEEDVKVSDLRDLRLEEIVADPAQPRRTFEETALVELTESIRVHGVLQPIVVTPKDGKFMIVAGERRFRASKAAGQKTIPALIRTLSDQHKLELALIENLHRRDLNAIETATAYAKLRGQFNMTLEDIGKSVGGKSVSAISNTLRLLKLPKEVQEAIASGAVSEGQVRPLVGMDESKALKLLGQIVDQHLSARTVEQLVGASAVTPRSKNSQKSASFRNEEHTLRQVFGKSVSVRPRTGGKGRIVIDFDTTDDLQQIIKRIK